MVSDVLTSYLWAWEGSTEKFTILFRRFNPNTVSSQFTLTDISNGSEHLPSTVMVIKHGAEVLKILLLNRKHKPVASSSFAATGKSTDTRWRFALLSIFNARLRQITRNLSSTNELSPLSLSNSSMWSVKVHLLKKTQHYRIAKTEWEGVFRKLLSISEKFAYTTIGKKEVSLPSYTFKHSTQLRLLICKGFNIHKKSFYKVSNVRPQLNRMPLAITI